MLSVSSLAVCIAVNTALSNGFTLGGNGRLAAAPPNFVTVLYATAVIYTILWSCRALPAL